jgi:tetratricopeptide (TPR) repeat protein
MKTQKIAFLILCVAAVAATARADVWYYNLTNNIGRIELKKMGPFLSQWEAERTMRQDRGQGLSVGPCFSETADSATLADLLNGPIGNNFETYPSWQFLDTIKETAALNPKPEIPEGGREHFIKAGTLMKAAKEPSDYELAAKEYLAARQFAPWWPNVYYNLALVREAEKKYDMAITDLKFYLASNPDDARAVQDKLYQIQAEKDLAVKHTADEAQQKQQAAEKAQEQIAGNWILDEGTDHLIVISKSGSTYSASLSPESYYAGSNYIQQHLKHLEVFGTQVSITISQSSSLFGDCGDDSYKLRLSDDGQKLVGTEDYNAVHPNSNNAGWHWSPSTKNVTLRRQ